MLLVLTIPVRCGLEFLDLHPMLSFHTFMDVACISVVSGIRPPVSPVDHPAVGLLFLPGLVTEEWSHHIINSGPVTHTCTLIRKRPPWKRGKKEKKMRRRNSKRRRQNKCPEPLAMLSFCLTLETSLRV